MNIEDLRGFQQKMTAEDGGLFRSRLFWVGAALAGGLNLINGLHFLLSFATGGLTSLLTFDSYLSYVIAIVLVFASKAKRGTGPL